MDILEQIIAYKRKQVSEDKNSRPLSLLKEKIKLSKRNFRHSLEKKLRPDLPNLIAEIKKASPSKGIIRENFDYLEIAKLYQDYAQAISVLTDDKFFLGSLQFLADIDRISRIPLLRKDFIIDEYQIYEARFYGADAILLIATCLKISEMERFIKIASDLNMDCLVEIHDEKDLKKVLATNAQIIGINNRNLRDFSIDRENSKRLGSKISETKKEAIIVSESGFGSQKSIQELNPYVDAVLIGSSLMESENIEEKLIDLFGGKVENN